MLDHNPTGGGEWRRGDGPNASAAAAAGGAVLEIYSPVAVHAGESAYLNYGQRSNGQLLLSCVHTACFFPSPARLPPLLARAPYAAFFSSTHAHGVAVRFLSLARADILKCTQ